jgi:hypothetical protein
MSANYESRNTTIDNFPVIMEAVGEMWKIRQREIGPFGNDP